MVESELRSPNAFLGYTVARLAHVMQRRIDDALRSETGLTVRQFGVLAHLVDDPGLGSGQLARLVMITPQSMGALLDGLEAAGLIARDRSAARGTRMATRLTSDGHAALDAAYAVAAGLAAEERAWLPADEAARLNARLLDLLDRLSSPSQPPKT